MKVNSSNIDEIHYTPEKKLLTVHFKSGKVYEYTGVDATTHQGFLNAPSHGKFFHSNINGKYVEKKLK